MFQFGRLIQLTSRQIIASWKICKFGRKEKRDESGSSPSYQTNAWGKAGEVQFHENSHNFAIYSLMRHKGL